MKLIFKLWGLHPVWIRSKEYPIAIVPRNLTKTSVKSDDHDCITFTTSKSRLSLHWAVYKPRKL